MTALNRVTAVAKRTKQRPPLPPPVAHVRRIAPWPRPEEADPDAKPERGDDAVQHGAETRGRRSRLFPDLNITETAKKLGITKSHLAKVLAGQNKPSLDLAKKIADALQKDLTYVVALSDNSFRQDEPAEDKPKKRKAS